MAAAITVSPSQVLAWGMHPWITKAAVDCLPEWQKAALGAETERLVAEYSLIPDWVYSRKDLAPFAQRDDKPGVLYHENLHLPPDQKEMFAIVSYFLGHAADAWRAGNTADACKYLGTLAHALEDWGCPAHTVPGDNQFNLMKQFLPPPEDQRDLLIHGPMEGGSFAVDIAGYRPTFLGATVPEAAYQLTRRAAAGVSHARGQVIPIMQALYAGDKPAVAAAQRVAADVDARTVADLLHTFLCLVCNRVDPAELDALRTVDVSVLVPLEAPNYFVPQSMFFGKPYWGQPLRGVHLRKGNGRDPVPLALKIHRDGQVVEETFADGIGVGTRSVLTYLVPEGVYQRFEAWVGVHPGMGGGGSVVFEVLANGKSVGRAGPLTADVPAHPFSIPLAGVSEVQFITTGGDGKAVDGNYAVWGRPRWVK